MKMFIKRIGCLAVSVAMLAGLAGCKPAEDETPITIAMPTDIVTMDVSDSKDMVSEAIGRCAYTTLYVFDQSLGLVPCLAESATQLSDTEWAFKLREDAVFSNGDKITAEDVAFSVERAKKQKNVDSTLAIIDHFVLIDDYNFKVITTGPSANLLSVFVRVSTSVMSKDAMADPKYDINKPVCSGPFEITSRVEGQHVNLKRNERYFLEPAKSKYLNFRFIVSEQERTAALLNSSLDVIFRVSTHDSFDLDLNDTINLHSRDSTKMELLMLNVEQKPLDDIRVRQAITHAINRKALVDNLLDGYGSILNSVLPPPLAGSIAYEGFDYDPDRARELLKEAGYEDGFKLSIIAFDAVRNKTLSYIKQDLAQVGIDVNYEVMDTDTYLDIIRNDDHYGTMMSWTSNADPDSTFSQLYSVNSSKTTNQPRFTDPRVEEIITQGRSERDANARKQLYEEANRIVCEDYCFIPLYQPMVIVAAAKDIQGVTINPQGLFAFENLYRAK